MWNVECGVLNCAPMAHVELFNEELRMSTLNIQHCGPAATIQHSTFHTQHSTLRPCRNHSTFNIPHSTFNIAALPQTFNIQHSTFNIAALPQPFNIQHSTFNIQMQNPPDYRHDTVLPLPLEVTANAWAVDAACSGNPGPMEYQAIDLATGAQVFHFGPVHGTNNIGEFLAIVHALALLDKQGITGKTIYSDSHNAILWVQKKQCKTKLTRTPQTEQLYQIIARAENWLRTHQIQNPIVKWETKKWGEVPADFGRK